MEAEVSSEMFVTIYQTTWRHITEDNNLHCSVSSREGSMMLLNNTQILHDNNFEGSP
jgi:hypothetical protein